MAEEIDKKGIIKALVLAVLISFLGIGILGWQYRQLEKERIPALEEKIEKKSAEDVLDSFMKARISGDEKIAERYLTEVSMEQKMQKEFVLIGNFESYEILSAEKTEQDEYRYLVKVYEEGGQRDFVEVIILLKILDKYYVNSAQIAG